MQEKSDDRRSVLLMTMGFFAMHYCVTVRVISNTCRCTRHGHHIYMRILIVNNVNSVLRSRHQLARIDTVYQIGNIEVSKVAFASFRFNNYYFHTNFTFQFRYSWQNTHYTRDVDSVGVALYLDLGLLGKPVYSK